VDFPSSTRVPTVIVVEDEALIGVEIVTILSESGIHAIGPLASAEAALSAIRNLHIDGAVIDLDLNGNVDFKVANLLAEAHVPFVIYTGADTRLVPHQHHRVPCFAKPAIATDIVEKLLVIMDHDHAE
jgi:chemotaxis family two-component system sensor kinase Cph1